MVVVIDHFSKWVEAEALSTITPARVSSFFRNNVIFRYDMPHKIVTDNGKQFDSGAFRYFCEVWHIRLHFTLVAHLQTNGLTEVTNRTILEGLKKRLDGEKLTR